MKMKVALQLLASIMFFASANAQLTTPATLEKYDVVISFNSMCCGTASNDFLKEFITNFNAKNKVALNVWQLTGCGREGESKVVISTGSIKKSVKTKLMKSLKTLIPQQNEKNKAIKASIGNIDLEYGIAANTITNCRGHLVRFALTTSKVKIQ